MRNFFSSALIILITASVAFCAESEPQYSLKTKYLIIYYRSNDDLARLERSLASDAARQGGGGMEDYFDSAFEDVLSSLGTPPLRRKVGIRLFKNRDELKTGSESLGLEEVPRAFFVKKDCEIYFNIEDINAEMVAHEYAHALAYGYSGEKLSRSEHEKLARYITGLTEKQALKAKKRLTIQPL